MIGWTALELRPETPLSEFLVESLAPRWASLQPSNGRAFYVLWFEDSSIRLRIQAECDDANLQNWLTFPQATVTEGTYSPEVERYGGPSGLRLAEDFFCLSSQLALRLLRQGAARSTGALAHPLAAAAVAGHRLAEGLRWPVRQLYERWFRDLLSPRPWRNVEAVLARRQKNQLLPDVAILQEELGEVGTELALHGMRLGRMLLEEVDDARAVSSSLLHGFMNRLAVEPLDELYIVHLLLGNSGRADP